MSVLILHQHFNTPQKGGAIRSYYLGKALVENGIKVFVITAHAESTYKIENVEGIQVHYLPIPYNNNFGFYKRSFAFIRYVWGVLTIAKKIKDIKICYAISVPLTVGIAAMWLKRVFKIPFIFEVGDLWPDAPIQLGFIQNYFFKRSLYKLEKIIYQEAKAIVALSPMIRQAIQQKIKSKTIHLIPNMADIDFYKPEHKDKILAEKFKVDRKFVVAYVGAVGYANGLDYFLECARATQKLSLPIHFLLVGDGAMLRNLKKAAKDLQIENLTFVPFQNRAGVREIMNIADASFICYRPAPILETGSPNKYFDGLAAGKMIIVNFGGWIKDEIEKEQCGIYLNPRSPSDFAIKIEKFLANKNLQEEYKENARKLAVSKYARKELGELFASLFKS